MKKLISICFLSWTVSTFAQHGLSVWAFKSNQDTAITISPWELSFLKGGMVIDGRYNFDFDESVSLFAGNYFANNDSSVIFAPLIGTTVGKTFSLGVTSHLIISKKNFFMYTMVQGLLQPRGFVGYNWAKFCWQDRRKLFQIGITEQLFPAYNYSEGWNIQWELGPTVQVNLRSFYLAWYTHFGVTEKNTRNSLGVGYIFN
jgi:hypothetical protein